MTTAGGSTDVRDQGWLNSMLHRFASASWGRRSLVIATVAACAFLAFVVVTVFWMGLTGAAYFTGYAADGPFQLYNPLRRLAAGELPGRDVPFFHGAGVLVVHLPLFLLFGGTLFASEIARWTVSALFFFGSGFFFTYSLFRRVSLAVIALAVYTALVLPMDRMVDPSNSLLGVRTTLPLVVAGALLWRGARIRSFYKFRFTIPTVVAFVSAAAAVSFGTEQGVAAVGALVVTLFARRWREHQRFLRSLARAVADAAILAVMALLVSELLTLGNAVPALRYGLSEVPADQGWVFGAPPNVAPTWSAVIADVQGGPTLNVFGAVPHYWLLWLAALALIAVAVRVRALEAAALWVAGYLSLYGVAVLVSIVGYINLIDQMAPLGRVAALLAGAGLTAIAFCRRLPSRSASSEAEDGDVLSSRSNNRATLAFALVTTVFATAVVVAAIPPRIDRLSTLPTEKAAANIEAGTLDDYEILGDSPGDPTRWKESVDHFAPYLDDADATVWSTYTSIYDSLRGDSNPSPGGEDYIIHALGADRRDAYSTAFQQDRPDYVITMNPAYFPYEEWLWSRWPGVYESLFADYEIVSTNQSHFLWKRLEGSGSRETGDDLPVIHDGATDRLDLPANASDRPKLYEISVDYEAGTTVAPLSRIPRYFLLPDQTGLTYPISLPSYETRWTFVVPVLPGQENPSLRTLTQGLIPGRHLDLASATISEMKVDPTVLALLSTNYCETSYLPATDPCQPGELLDPRLGP